MRANTLKQVVLNFDPREPLSGDKLASWFVARNKSPRERLKIALTIEAKPQKVLLIGHRGSGKTTELNKLSEEVKEHFHIIGFNVLDITGRTNLEYEDLMLAISTQVTRDCIRNGLINRPLSAPVRKGWEDLRDWWRQVVAGTELSQTAAEAEIGVQLSTLLGQIELGVSQSSLTREALKDQINRQMPDLIKRLNWVIEQAEAGDRKRLLIVVEGLDKVDFDSALSIFQGHGTTITKPSATMIYTFPILLHHSHYYNAIEANFSSFCFLPNLVTRDVNGAPNTAGRDTLRNLVLARMEERLIEPDALDLIIEANGGVPVRLVSLMRAASLFALERDERANRITCDDVREAVRELRTSMSKALTREDLQVLRARHKDRKLTNDAAEQRLLYNGSLIDYSHASGEMWCDAHPALWPLLEQDDYANTGPRED
jgi:energy-coupling factor transporter ATP-binding protein EcfA2